jgi:hypothetical protein
MAAAARGRHDVLPDGHRFDDSCPHRGDAGETTSRRLDGNYFSREGHRFIPMGAHWVPAKAGMQWPVQWDPKDIEADFAKMHELGYSIVRFDVMWAREPAGR